MSNNDSKSSDLHKSSIKEIVHTSSFMQRIYDISNGKISENLEIRVLKAVDYVKKLILINCQEKLEMLLLSKAYELADSSITPSDIVFYQFTMDERYYGITLYDLLHKYHLLNDMQDWLDVTYTEINEENRHPTSFNINIMVYADDHAIYLSFVQDRFKTIESIIEKWRRQSLMGPLTGSFASSSSVPQGITQGIQPTVHTSIKGTSINEQKSSSINKTSSTPTSTTNNISPGYRSRPLQFNQSRQKSSEHQVSR